jgi:hypothetical protein
MKKTFVLFAIPLLVSCEMGHSSSPNFALIGEISSVYYEAMAGVSVFYDETLLGETSDSGSFSFDVNGEAPSSSKITFAKSGYLFHVVSEAESSDNTFVVKAIDDSAPANWYDFLYSVSGKIVLNSDGETRMKGAEIFLDDKLAETNESGDFDLEYIYRDTALSIKYEGYHFVDRDGASMDPYSIDQSIEGLTFRGVADNA